MQTYRVYVRNGANQVTSKIWMSIGMFRLKKKLVSSRSYSDYFLFPSCKEYHYMLRVLHLSIGALKYCVINFAFNYLFCYCIFRRYLKALKLGITFWWFKLIDYREHNNHEYTLSSSKVHILWQHFHIQQIVHCSRLVIHFAVWINRSSIYIGNW